MLYQAYDPAESEGVPVQYAGVYVTCWQREWGKPTILFCEVDEEEHVDLIQQSPEVQVLVKAVRESLDGDIHECKLCNPRRICAYHISIHDALAPFEKEDDGRNT